MLRSAGPGGAERELNRLDIKNRQPLPAELEAAVIAQLERLTPLVDGVVIADQVQERNYGVITDGVRAALARLAEAYPRKIFAADSRVRIGEFEGVIVKPNLQEARAAVEGGGLEEWKTGRLENWKGGSGRVERWNSKDGLALARLYGQALFAKNQQPVFVTLGAEGVLAVTAAGVEHIPGIPAAGPIDVVGAGDSVMAGVVTGLGAGGTAKEAAFIGNLAASITIQQLGTTGIASREQLWQRYTEMKTQENSG
jgi:bifunctional ADP-heptose synthase (sugar kinase/adenylyltransferase)